MQHTVSLAENKIIITNHAQRRSRSRFKWDRKELRRRTKQAAHELLTNGGFKAKKKALDIPIKDAIFRFIYRDNNLVLITVIKRYPHGYEKLSNDPSEW